MAASPEFIAQIEEMLAPLGPIRIRRMFSGAGIFCDGVMLGLIMEDVLYLRTDEAGRAAFEAEGMGPFVYTARGRRVSVSHWQAPDRLLDEADELVEWARRALAVARAVARNASKTKRPAAKAAATKKPSPRKRTRPSLSKGER